MNNGEFQEKAGQIERLVERASSLADEEARATALDLLQSLMDLHGAAITRIVELLSDSGDAGRASLEKLGKDPLICGLLVLYGVHPLPVEQRVADAIDAARPRLQKQNASAELLAVTDGVVRLKLKTAGHGCGSSTETLRQTIEQAILEAAPEIVEIVDEGAAASGFVPLSMIQPAAKEKKYEESAA